MNDLGMPLSFTTESNGALNMLEDPQYRFGEAFLQKMLKIWKYGRDLPLSIQETLEIARKNRIQHPLNEESVAVMSVPQVVALLQKKDLDERTFENVCNYFSNSPSVRVLCLQNVLLSPETLSEFFGMENSFRFGYATSLNEVRMVLEHPMLPIWIETGDPAVEKELRLMLEDHVRSFLRRSFRDITEDGKDSEWNLEERSVYTGSAAKGIRMTLRKFPSFPTFDIELQEHRTYPLDILEVILDIKAPIFLKMSVLEEFFSFLMEPDRLDIPRPDWMRDP